MKTSSNNNNIESKNRVINYDIEIVRDFDGTYYVNALNEQHEHIKGLPEYLPYKELKKTVKESLGVTLPPLKSLTFEGAREALINILCNYQGFKKCEVIVVFDAYKVKGQQREVERVNNISVVYTKEAETADMYIEKVSHQLAKRHRVRVVTSDALEQLIILGNGALRVSSRAFLEEVRQAEEEIRRLIAEEYADN